MATPTYIARLWTCLGTEAIDNGLDENQRRRLNALRIQDAVSLSTKTRVAGLVVAALATFIFIGHNFFVTLLMSAWLITIGGTTFRSILTTKPRRASSGSQASMTRMEKRAFVGALTWSVPATLFPLSATAIEAAIVTSVMAGTVALGFLALRSLQRAAFIWIGTTTLAGMICATATMTVGGLVLAIMGFFFAAAMAHAVHYHNKEMTRSFRNVNTIEEQTAVLGMLLQDHEEHSQDWIWQIDTALRIVRMPQTLSDLIGLEEGATIENLKERINPQDYCALLSALKARKSFKDLQFEVLTKDRGARFLQIWGSPAFEGSEFIGFKGVTRDVTDLHSAQRRNEWLARHDGATNLLNRTTYEASLAEWVKGDLPVAVVQIDLDRFKEVNDGHGHLTGDAVIFLAARRLREIVEATGVKSMVARMGGDEFSIGLRGFTGDPEATTRELADFVATELARPYDLECASLDVGASVGWTIAYEPIEVDRLINRADIALYEVKRSGRGRSMVFDPEIEARMREEKVFRADLSSALENGEFSLAFQPCVTHVGAERRIDSFEALIRWHHPVQGQVSPATFIPVAEDMGLIDRIGEWVLMEACRTASEWPAHIGLAVNVSSSQIVQKGFVRTVMMALSRAGLPAERLEVEITETALVEDFEATKETLGRLTALGVRIALDDFGTGYSSLSYLSALHFDRLKIDRSFVTALASDERSVALCKTITDMAVSFGMETTAEGIEIEDQANRLIEIGCHTHQGWFYAKAMSADDVRSLLKIESERRDPAEETTYEAQAVGWS